MSTRPAPMVTTLQPAIEISDPAGSAFIRDYLAAAPALAPFFSGHPADIDAYRRKAVEVDARLDAAARQRVAGALRPLSEGAARRLERVLRADGYAVTTGQQAGLFTGPLYTIVKALTAVRLARTLEARLERPVVALFWCAADDHDWAEVNHTHVVDGSNYVQRIALPDGDEETPPLAMSQRVLGPEAGLAVAALGSALPETEFRAARLAALQAAYAPGRTMAAAFEAALADVLAGHDLVLVSSAHPLVKQHARPLLERALAEAPAQEQAVATQTARLEAAGYDAQVSVAAGASNVFRQDELGRDRLVRDGAGWLLRRTRRRLTAAALADELAQRPDAYSPGVLLRPVVESALFPTLAYVGGPAESGYFAQIGCLFRAHGIEPPIVYPRPSVTLVEHKVRKVLEKFGLASSELRRPFEEVAAQLVREQMPPEVTAALEALRAALQEGYARLGEAASGIDPTLQGPLTGARNQALSQSAEIEKKIRQHLRQRSETRLEQIRKAAANLYPDGAPQERVLNVYPYLVRYGPDLLTALLEQLPDRLAGPSPGGWDGLDCPGARVAAPSRP